MNGSSDASNATDTAPSGDRASRDRALFDRIASSYARKDLYEPSRIARMARLRRTLDLCGEASGADVLEIGCGAGFAAEYLRGRFATYTGIDYSEALIRFAAGRESGSDTAFYAADLYDWQPTARYDLIFAIGVLHHMPDIEGAMTRMHDLLRPGGALVVNEPQPANPLIHALRRIRTVVDDSYSSEQEELAESELIGYFRDAGFEGIRTRGQGLLSTPFAEVPLAPRLLARPLSAVSCRVDAWLEDHLQPIVKPLAWNIVVVGRRAGVRQRPEHDPRADVD